MYIYIYIYIYTYKHIPQAAEAQRQRGLGGARLRGQARLRGGPSRGPDDRGALSSNNCILIIFIIIINNNNIIIIISNHIIIISSLLGARPPDPGMTGAASFFGRMFEGRFGVASRASLLSGQEDGWIRGRLVHGECCSTCATQVGCRQGLRTSVLF